MHLQGEAHFYERNLNHEFRIAITQLEMAAIVQIATRQEQPASADGRSHLNWPLLLDLESVAISL